MSTHTLYDAGTDEDLGPATFEQVDASYHEDTGTGIILVDGEGFVLQPGSWDDGQPGVRRVYVSGLD